MISRLLVLFFLFQSLLVLAQDTTYLGAKMDTLISIKEAKYYNVNIQDKQDANRMLESHFQVTGELISEFTYLIENDKKLWDGQYKNWNSKGQLHRYTEYTRGKKNGKFVTFWDNGNPKRVDLYKNGQFIDGECFDMEGNKITYYNFHIDAEFPGGPEALSTFLKNTLTYPKKLQKKGIEGRVLVNFTINRDGQVSNVTIKKGVNEEFDKEALRAMKKMPLWKPAEIDGKKVNQSFRMPIVFHLQ